MTDYKWCVLDVEGDAGEKGLQGVAVYSDMGQAYLRESYLIELSLYRHAEMGYTFVAHNASYDLSVIVAQLGIPWKAVYYSGRFNHGEWKYDRKRPPAMLWDSLELSGRISVADLGRSVGIEKLPTPQRLLGIEPDRLRWQCGAHQRWECEECYAIRDAEIVYTFMTSLETMLAGWGVEPYHRLSGLASRIWRALDRPAPIALRDRKIERLARDAFHGGRVECYKLGVITPCYSADICSSYAWCLANTPMPDPHSMTYGTNWLPDDVPWEREGVAEADVCVPQMYLPPLPYRAGEQLLYPVGRFRGCWTLLELRHAVSLGCTVEYVHRLAYATETLSPFRQFVGTLWAMREAYEQSDDPRRFLAKLLLNNLYGFLGLREQTERSEVWEWAKTRPPRGDEVDDWSVINDRLFVRKERVMYTGGRTRRNTDHCGDHASDWDDTIGSPWTNVLWAAQVAAAGRVRLYHYMRLQGSSLLYADTDGIMSMSPIIGLGEGLGQLRDPQEYAQAVLIAPKEYGLYRHDGTTLARAKGMKRDRALQFLSGQEVIYREPISPIAAVRRGIMAGEWVDVSRHRLHVPPRRQPLTPGVLLSGEGWTDTQPPFVG